MSTEFGGRAVLRPAGNVTPVRATIVKKAVKASVKKKPCPPPVVAAAKAASPPNSQLSSPRAFEAAVASPQTSSSPVQKPNPSPKLHSSLSPTKPLIPAAISCSESSLRVRLPAVRITEPLDDIPSCLPNTGPSKPPHSPDPYLSKVINHGIPEKVNRYILNQSTRDIALQKSGTSSNVKAIKPATIKKSISVGFDDASLLNIVTVKKAAATELYAQRKLKAAEYGRRQAKASRVVPDAEALSTEPRRCKFITCQNDPLQVAYHDEEWGVPVHDDRMLFELLALSGAQLELSWSKILHKRDAYRAAFSGFDYAAVASFTEKDIKSLETSTSLMLSAAKIRGVVENARCISEVVREYGSFDKYLWGFFNNKPIINSHRHQKELPLKTSKSESISKDLVRRGFRIVGPSIVYSFMQAAGMVNDHLLQCFRHQECADLCFPSLQANQNQLTNDHLRCITQLEETCDTFTLLHMGEGLCTDDDERHLLRSVHIQAEGKDYSSSSIQQIADGQQEKEDLLHIHIIS